MRTTRLAALSATAALAATFFTAAPAAAGPAMPGSASVAPTLPAEVEREVSDTCSGGARWDLSLEREFGVIDIGFEVDGATPGQRWTVLITRNGAQILRTVRPADAEGEVDVTHLVRDRAGSDRFSVRATSASGEVCRATLRI